MTWANPSDPRLGRRRRGEGCPPRWEYGSCDIKTTLGMDGLRCQSGELIEKEVWLQAITCNLVRALMLEAA